MPPKGGFSVFIPLSNILNANVFKCRLIADPPAGGSNVNCYLCETALKTFDSAGVVFYNQCFL